MPQLTERDAETLSSEQATALIHILDLQAKWDGLLGEKIQTVSMVGLHSRQKAHDAFQAALRKYTGQYGPINIPEPTQTVPDRLTIWYRVLRSVLRRTEGASVTHLMAKVYRLADRIALRQGKELVARQPAECLAEAVGALDAVIAWCDGLTPLAPQGRCLETRTDAAA